MNKLKFILIGVIGFLAVSSIFMTIETATSGMEIANLEKKEASLINEKRNLQTDLIKSLSLAELQEKSVDLGFMKPVDMVYVAEGAPVANAN